jgi:adenosine deaminase
VYLELRTTPRSIPQNGITNEIYVRTILECIAEHQRRPYARLRTKLILSVDRRWTAEQAEEVVEIAIKYRSKGVVAVDLCGDPSKGDVSIFSSAFAKAKAAGLRITLHFAEAPASASDKELSVLLDMKPDRVGHVIHVKDEHRTKIVQQGIGVELCLSCNVHAKMITGDFPDHHFGWWRTSGAGVALCVCLSPPISTAF